MSIDNNVLEELESDYWYSIHNHLSPDVTKQAFYTYQRIITQYLVLNAPLPPNNYDKVHDHFYNKYLRGRNDS